MLSSTETGIIEKTIRKTYEEACIEWRISDISTIAKVNDVCFGYDSPAFFINDVSWFLRLFPRSSLNPESMRLYIYTSVEREYSVEYNVGVKKSDGSVLQLITGIHKGGKIHDVGDIIRKTELLQQKSELVSQNTLTIICTLKYEIAHSTQPVASDLITPLTLISLDTLSKNFKNLFDDKESCDTTLKVKDKEFKAHRSVLIARSTVFAATFKHDTLEKQTGIVTISDCDPDSFPQFLEFLYCGRLEELSHRSALNLYYTSDKYDVEELKVFCIEYLMQCLTVENICEIVVFADKYDITKLCSSTHEYFNQNAREILETSEWENLLISNHRLANKLMKEYVQSKT